jgi:hypothetical protein
MSGYSEKARVPVFDDTPANFDHWEIHCNAFVEVEGISGILGDALNAYMPEDVNEVVIPETSMLTELGKGQSC